MNYKKENGDIESSYWKFKIGKRKLEKEIGKGKLEKGNWKKETGNWKQETGYLKMDIGK